MAHKLARIRNLLKQNHLGAYVLPRTDEHQNQYLTQRDERVKFISGFSGSNALTFISITEALLWTDSRYLIQAEKQLKEGWQLKKMLPSEPKWYQYITSVYSKPFKIGFDPTLLTAKGGNQRIKHFFDKGIDFVPLKKNLVDQIWEDRPSASQHDIFLHEQWAGKSMREKVYLLRERIKQKNGSAAIFNDLSEIAWLLNLRSSEIPHNPFFKSVLVITLNGGRLYLPASHPSLKNQTVINHLSSQHIELSTSDPCFEQNSLVVLDKINFSIFLKIKDKKYIQWEGIDLYRAVRPQKQIRGFRRCHVSDGIAMAKFWAWRAGKETVMEFQAAQKMDSLRKMQHLNQGISFDTISAGGPNGAIIHYRPMADSNSLVTRDMIHLVDSGGQYLDGTTDVTRAFHFGQPTQQEKQAYTRVLMGNLDIERLQWPQGTLTGAHIDVLARRHLWSRGWNYLHGTGHGVGYFAGVHEMPVTISPYSQTKFKAGMIVTNEPGFYKQGSFGIRIENMLLVQERQGFNFFQNLTLCPYDRNLIELSLLDRPTREYIDQYHLKVRTKLTPHLQDDQQTLKWLRKATQPL